MPVDSQSQSSPVHGCPSSPLPTDGYSTCGGGLATLIGGDLYNDGAFATGVVTLASISFSNTTVVQNAAGVCGWRGMGWLARTRCSPAPRMTDSLHARPWPPPPRPRTPSPPLPPRPRTPSPPLPTPMRVQRAQVEACASASRLGLT